MEAWRKMPLRVQEQFGVPLDREVLLMEVIQGWNYHSAWTSGSKDRDLWTYGTQSEHNTELTAVQVELPEDL
jgi:hypothetical protein